MNNKNEYEILNICQDITGTINALYSLPLTDEEAERMIKDSCRKMDDWFINLDLCLWAKSYYEILQLLQTDTVRSFLGRAQSYLQDQKAVFSGMDIEKGYYNIKDYFYMCLESWYNAFQRRINILHEEQSEPETTAPEPQQEPEYEDMDSMPTRGRGRPKETLRDKMVCDADGKKLQRLHDIWGGRKGKDAALIILACIKKGWMTKPTYTQVKNEFGDIGSKTGYNRYLYEQMFTREELEGAINSVD